MFDTVRKKYSNWVSYRRAVDDCPAFRLENFRISASAVATSSSSLAGELTAFNLEIASEGILLPAQRRVTRRTSSSQSCIVETTPASTSSHWRAFVCLASSFHKIQSHSIHLALAK